MASIFALNPPVFSSKSSCSSKGAFISHSLPGILQNGWEFRLLPIPVSGFYKQFNYVQNKSMRGGIRRRRNRIACEVALEETDQSIQSQELKAQIGAKVKVSGSLKVYHVPKAPDLELEGMEGHIKEYVGIWKGKRLSANLPYKVQFTMDVGGRPVKFFAHLKENEFDVVS